MHQDFLSNFQEQKNSQQKFKEMGFKERKLQLKKLLHEIQLHSSEIESALNSDYQKSSEETKLTEIYPTIRAIKHILSHLESWMNPTKVDATLAYLGTTSEIIYEPKGVCAIIAPWNYPFLLVMSPLAQAIAAGNAVMIKPSEYTPHTSALLKRILSKVFSSDQVAVIEGDHEVSTALLKLKFDHIFFTGSPMIGKVVMKAAAEHLTSITLELGGKSPVIIGQSANISNAAEKVMWAKLLNNGQTCIAPDFVFVHESVQELFIQQCKEAIKKMYGDDPKQSKDYCRIVNAKHFARIQSLYLDAVKKGCQVHTGGNMDLDSNYIAPTILTDIASDSAILEEEIFGPILPIISFKEISDPINYLRKRDKPLASYIFSKDQKEIDFFLYNTSSGSTCINEIMLQFTQPNLPFGGVNTSGLGRANGKFGFIEFSNQRSVLRQFSPFSVTKLLFPPYQLAWKKKLIDLVLKWF
ncbi:MAG: aldehyde dehydrogenase family protein [Chitinophagales bacterium]|nr:aldehyde dehydrogenase family protein [Chitinophagales bacterium]